MDKRIIHALLLTTLAFFVSPSAAQSGEEDILENKETN